MITPSPPFLPFGLLLGLVLIPVLPFSTPPSSLLAADTVPRRPPLLTTGSGQRSSLFCKRKLFRCEPDFRILSQANMPADGQSLLRPALRDGKADGVERSGGESLSEARRAGLTSFQ